MAFKDFLEELYEPMGGVTVRSMFGGLGVFKEATMFALAVDDVLYLRADDAGAARYAAEKCEQFVYHGMKGREVAMPYWRLPERLFEDSDEFTAWSEAAFDVARKAAAEKKGKKPRPKPLAKSGNEKPSAAAKVGSKHSTAKRGR